MIKQEKLQTIKTMSIREKYVIKPNKNIELLNEKLIEIIAFIKSIKNISYDNKYHKSAELKNINTTLFGLIDEISWCVTRDGSKDLKDYTIGVMRKNDFPDILIQIFEQKTANRTKKESDKRVGL